MTLSIWFKSFILVIGDPKGLEREWSDQVFQVGRLAGLEPNEVPKMVQEMEKVDSYYYWVNKKDHTVFTLLLSPTVADLKSAFSNSVLCREVDI